MKWFKHMTNARNNPELSSAIDELGLEVYGAYMIILEVVAERMDGSSDCFAEYSPKKWSTFLQVSPKRFQNFAKTLEKCGLFLLKDSGKLLKIEVPNLVKYRDNHTKNLQVTSKPLTINLALEVEKEKEKEREVDKEKKDNAKIPQTGAKKVVMKKYDSDFEVLWKKASRYNQTNDEKKKAYASYKLCLKCDFTLDQINQVLNQWSVMNKNRGSDPSVYTPLSRYLEPNNVKDKLERPSQTADSIEDDEMGELMSQLAGQDTCDYKALTAGSDQ